MTTLTSQRALLWFTIAFMILTSCNDEREKINVVTKPSPESDSAAIEAAKKDSLLNLIDRFETARSAIVHDKLTVRTSCFADSATRTRRNNEVSHLRIQLGKSYFATDSTARVKYLILGLGTSWNDGGYSEAEINVACRLYDWEIDQFARESERIAMLAKEWKGVIKEDAEVGYASIQGLEVKMLQRGTEQIIFLSCGGEKAFLACYLYDSVNIGTFCKYLRESKSLLESY